MFCSKCGNQLSDNSIFCNKCGAKIEIDKKDSFSQRKKIVLDQSFFEQDLQSRHKNRPSSLFIWLCGGLLFCAVVGGFWIKVKTDEIGTWSSEKSKKEVVLDAAQPLVDDGRFKKDVDRALGKIDENEKNGIQKVYEFIKVKRDYSEMNSEKLNFAIKEFRIHKTTVEHEMGLDEKQRKKLIDKITLLRKQEMPKIRRRYADLLSKTIWRDNGSASVSGKNNTTINIIHPQFFLNANIEDFNNLMQPIFKRYGFKRATFWAYKGADSYSSSDYDVFDDGEF